MRPKQRKLDPEYFQSATLSKLPFEARILFAGLWTICDKEGKLFDNPALIKSFIFPYDNIEVDPLLTLLHNCGSTDEEYGCIVRYVVNNKCYIWIPKFLIHQTPAPKERSYKIPEISLNLLKSCTPEDLSIQTINNEQETIINKQEGKDDGKHPVSREDVGRITEKLRYLGDWAVVVNSMNGSARWVSTLIDKFGEDRVVSAADSILAYYTNKGLFPPRDLAAARTAFWNWCDRQRGIVGKTTKDALLEWAMQEDGDEPES